MPRCTCFHRDVTDDDIAFYQIGDDGWLWAHYYDCPAHGGPGQVSAVAAPGFVARDDEPATTVQAVPVELGDWK